jgi:hypothetical protein
MIQMVANCWSIYSLQSSWGVLTMVLLNHFMVQPATACLKAGFLAICKFINPSGSEKHRKAVFRIWTAEIVKTCLKSRTYIMPPSSIWSAAGRPVLQPHNNCWVNCLKSSRHDRLCQFHHPPGRNMAKWCWSLAAKICHFYAPVRRTANTSSRHVVTLKIVELGRFRTKRKQVKPSWVCLDPRGQGVKIIQNKWHMVRMMASTRIWITYILYSDCTQQPLVHLDANMA